MKSFSRPDRLLFKDAQGGQRLQVLGRRLPFRDACSLEVGDPAVGLLEDRVDQLAAVDLRLWCRTKSAVWSCESADGADL